METKKHGTNPRNTPGVKKSSYSAARLRSKKSTGAENSVSDDTSSQSPRYSFSTEIPERYNETYITAIPKDPYFMYVYWEFSDETRKMMDTTMEQTGSKLVLRVKDIESSEEFEEILPFDVDIDEFQEEKLVRIPENGKEYLVECGQINDNGEFIQIAQSVPVSVPLAEPSQPFFDTMISDDELRAELMSSTALYDTKRTDSGKLPGSISSETVSSFSKGNPGSSSVRLN